MRNLGAAVAAVLLLLGLGLAAPAVAQDSSQDETAKQAMRALGRTQDAWFRLGDLDHARYCEKMYGYAEAGFHYKTQAFYCRARDRWIKIDPTAACVSLFGPGAWAESDKQHCSRPGADPGPPVLKTAGNPQVVVIPEAAVDKPFDTSVPRPPLTAVADGGTAAIASTPASAVAAPGVADRPTASQGGPVGAFNQLPIILRVLIAGGGAMLVGVWAGGFVIRFMP